MTDEVIKFKALGEMAQRSRVGGANYVLLADFDRVTAERDALAQNLRFAEEGYVSFAEECDKLQQRLTAADERADVLEGLIGEVLDAVGREPLDLDAVLRLRARMRAALKPAEAPRNQCDGCQAGVPLINGTHRMGREGGYPDFMGCSAKLYKPAEGGGGGGDHVKHYECVGKGGDYTVVAIAQGAGTLKGFNHYVYKNADGVHFVRDPEDFLSRMQIKH